MASVIKDPKKLTIIHSADWHVCDDFLEDAQNCLDFLVNQTQEIRPDLIVISGDIYNHRQIRQESAAARLAFLTVRQLAAIAPVIILIGTPSHDGQAPELLRGINEKHPVWIEGAPNNLIVYRAENGQTAISHPGAGPDQNDDFTPIAFISCVPAFTKQHFSSNSDIATSDMEIATALASIFAQFGLTANEIQRKVRHQSPGNPIAHILLGHWSIGGAFIHPTQAITGLDIEIAREHVEMANADLVCMGHIHAQQKINPNIFYCGSLFAMDFGEMEAKGFYKHTLELADMEHHWELCGSKFIPTPSPQLIRIDSDLLKCKDECVAHKILRSAVEGLPANPNAIIRHEVRIYQDMAPLIDQGYIRELAAEHAGPRKYDLNLNRLPRPNVRSARVLEVDRLRDKVRMRAEIINEPVESVILGLADMLEEMEPEEIYQATEKEVRI